MVLACDDMVFLYEPRTADACGSERSPKANRGRGLLISASVTLASACRTTRLMRFQLSVTGQSVSCGQRRPCVSLHCVREMGPSIAVRMSASEISDASRD